MRSKIYINIAINLISHYDGNYPLTAYLKKYFAENKKHGSKDRKLISHLCYSYFRVGNSLHFLSIQDKITTALFLCNDNSNFWKDLFNDEWINNWQNLLSHRIAFVAQQYPNFKIENIFSFSDELSSDIDKEAFCIAHLVQPNLFLRIRPLYNTTALKKLADANIHYTLENKHCIALPNATKIDEVLQINKEVVIQDYASQQIANFLQAINFTEHKITVLDCCAASGGKSILVKDVLKNIELTVSDIRKTILQNLQKRFAESAINNYQTFVADIAANNFVLPKNIQQKFKLIICDAPCSGSGTWSRTPEQLHFFNSAKINEYALLQRKIISNTIKHIEQNGYFLYITCSVFKKENEEIVNFIQENFKLQLIKMQTIIGYTKKADSMFAALFQLT